MIKKIVVALMLFAMCVSCQNESLAEKRAQDKQRREERREQRITQAEFERSEHEKEKLVQSAEKEKRRVAREQYKESHKVAEGEFQEIVDGYQVYETKLQSVVPVEEDLLLTFENGLVLYRDDYFKYVWHIGRTYKIYLKPASGTDNYVSKLVKIE